jgi:hypothetical protein
MPEGILQNLKKILTHSGGVVPIVFTVNCRVTDDDQDDEDDDDDYNNPIIQTREQKEAPQIQQTDHTYVYSTIILIMPINLT